MDEEIQRLMEELIIRRTQQRDYQSLDDQIRCMRQRFENLKYDQEREINHGKEEVVAREKAIELSSQKVDDMHE